MILEYVYLISHLIDFKNKYPEYTKQINAMLLALWKDEEIIAAIDADLNTLEDGRSC